LKSVPVLLLVEDNPDDAELTRVALDDSKLLNKLVVVQDGQEALDWLWCEGKYKDRDPCLLPSLVLLDLKLPKVSGLEVLQRLRADPRTKHAPVVILTSSREEKDIIGSYDLGANSYIQKPVDYKQFVKAVRQLGVYWMVLNAPPPTDSRAKKYVCVSTHSDD
jgi:CheY-like chemotaxis protein